MAYFIRSVHTSSFIDQVLHELHIPLESSNMSHTVEYISSFALEKLHRFKVSIPCCLHDRSVTMLRVELSTEWFKMLSGEDGLPDPHDEDSHASQEEALAI